MEKKEQTSANAAHANPITRDLYIYTMDHVNWGLWDSIAGRIGATIEENSNHLRIKLKKAIIDEP